MKRKKMNLFVILFLLLSALVVAAAAKAFCDPHGLESSNEAVPVTTVPEDEDGAAEIIPPIEELTEAETLPSEQAEIPLRQESPSCSPQAVESTENKEPSIGNTEGTPEDAMIVPASMENTLFIGDSRTVGLAEYAQMEGAEFFASVGMSVYEIDKAKVSVPNVGKVTLSELLENQSYDRIYVMLGINELGYPFEQLVKKYGDFIQYLQNAQPDSTIFILANLHVTKSRSDREKVINNPAINSFNEAISGFADNEHIFYLDANCIFDDADGALSEAKSGDHAHPLAKYYQEWGNWIAEQTGAILAQLM